VTDDECPACLEEIPAAAALLDSLALPGADAVAVALGDRFEARRTFWGLQAGIPLVWSSRRDLPASLGIERTPALLLDWCGRIVDASIEPVDRPSGRRRLLAMLRRWSGGWTDR